MLMHDFYAGFSLKEPETKERKDSLADAAARGVLDYQNRNQISESFDISYARDYLSEMKVKHNKCDKCLVNIEKKKEVYIIMLVLLDKNNNPLKTTTKEAFGKKISAVSLTEDTERFMGGKISRILTV